jgi:hypothetical protein
MIMQATIDQKYAQKTSANCMQLILPCCQLNAELADESDQIYTEFRNGPLTPESELLAEGSDSAASPGDEDYADPFYATSLQSLIHHYKVVTFILPQEPVAGNE